MTTPKFGLVLRPADVPDVYDFLVESQDEEQRGLGITIDLRGASGDPELILNIVQLRLIAMKMSLPQVIDRLMKRAGSE